MSLFRAFLVLASILLVIPGWLSAASSLPLETVITYDFEDQSLGPIGLGGPDEGQPYWKSGTLDAEVIEFEGGQALQISSETGGFEGLRFELPGQQGIREHRARVRLRIMHTEETYMGLGFRGPLGASTSYGTLHTIHTGGFQVTSAGGLPALNFGSYTAGEVFELVFDMDLYNRTWDIWLDGVREVTNRPMSDDFATSAGLGRFFFTGSSFYDGSPIVIDELAIERSRDLPVLLDTDFDDKPSGAIGTGGPELGEPVAVGPSVLADVSDDGDGGQVLTLERMAWVGPEQPLVDWAFLYDAEPDSGLVEADFTLTPRVPGLYVATLHDSDGNDVASIQVDPGLNINLVFPGETPIAVGDVGLTETVRIRLACHLDQRDCSVALNDRWAVFNEMFSDSTPDGIAIAGLRTGHLGTSPAGSRYDLGDVTMRSSDVAGLAREIEFLQQPSTTQCGMTIIPQIGVAVTDAFGETVPDLTVVTLSHDNDGIPPGALTGAIAEVLGGEALFDAVFTQRADNIRLTVTVGDAFNSVSGISDLFDILPGPASSGEFLVQPADAGAGQAIAPAVEVRVLDNCAEPQPAGIPYVLGIAEGPAGAILSNATAVSDDSGTAVFESLSADLPGTYRLSVQVDGMLLSGMSDPFTISALPGAASFEVQPSETRVGQLMAPAVAVKVDDTLGVAMPDGTAVSLVLEDADGVDLSGGSATTAGGVAVFDTLAVSAPGQYRLRASVPGLAPDDEPLSDLFDIVPGPPAQIDFQQQPVDGTAGTVLAPALVARVTDVDGFDVPDGVTVTVDLASGPAGGELAGTLSASTESGLVSFDDLVVVVAGQYRLRAVLASGLEATGDQFNVLPGAVVALSFEVEPGSGTVNQVLTPAVEVRALDAWGNGVADGLSIELDIADGPAGAAVTGNLATTESGLASFSALVLDHPGSYQLRAIAAGDDGPVEQLSTQFDIAPGAPALLSFEQQPTDTLLDSVITPAILLRLTDADGFAVADGLVELTLTAGPDGAELSGTLSRAVVDGLAVFDDLQPNLVGTYRLHAEHGSLSVESDDFTVVADRIFNDRFQAADP